MMTNIVSRFPSCKWLRRPARLVLFPGSVFAFPGPTHRFFPLGVGMINLADSLLAGLQVYWPAPPPTLALYFPQ